MRKLIILIALVLLSVGVLAQEERRVPYETCPEIDGIEVTSEWVEYHDELKHEWFFKEYRRYFKWFHIDGVLMASQGSYVDDTRLVYAGWYWDEPEGRYHNGHPSCGVWIFEGE
jgi:hypothetical protein